MIQAIPNKLSTIDRVEDMPRLRRVIAENMVTAKRTAAHVWTSVEVDFERVEQVPNVQHYRCELCHGTRQRE